MAVLVKKKDGGTGWADPGLLTQATSTTTGVTANYRAFTITTFTQTLAAGASVTFTVSNNTMPLGTCDIHATIVNYTGTFSTNGIPVVNLDNTISGASFDVVISNVHSANALSGTLTIAFLITGSNNS